MQTIQDVMSRNNPYALAFNHMSEVEEEEHRQPSEVRMYMRVGGERRRYNMPHHEEVAAFFCWRR